jgi:hypothetical protein
MNDTELDALLATPLPERDAGEFSVLLMEKIARHEARPARILAWITSGVMLVVIAAACVFGASAIGHVQFDDGTHLLVPSALLGLTLILSYTVLQSVRE